MELHELEEVQKRESPALATDLTPGDTT